MTSIKTPKTFTAIILATLLSAGCDKPARTLKAAPKPIKVKGFYIGMPLNEATNVAQTLGKEWICSYESAAGRIEIANEDLTIESLAKNRRDIDTAFYLFLDSQNKVRDFTIERECAKILFKSHDMDISDFVREFSKAYELPPIQRKEKWWQVITPDGVLIRISDYKDIRLQRAETPEKIRAKFD